MVWINAGLQRCGKSCRLRWINYLRPDLKRGMFSQEEEDLIVSLHEGLGNRFDIFLFLFLGNQLLGSPYAQVDVKQRKTQSKFRNLVTSFEMGS